MNFSHEIVWIYGKGSSKGLTITEMIGQCLLFINGVCLRPVKYQDQGLNILQYDKQTRSINILLNATVNYLS